MPGGKYSAPDRCVPSGKSMVQDGVPGGDGVAALKDGPGHLVHGGGRQLAALCFHRGLLAWLAAAGEAEVAQSCKKHTFRI